MKLRGTVSVPRQPRSPTDISRFGRETINCLKQLRDREIMIRRSAGGGGAAIGVFTPWKPNFFTEGEDESKVYKCRFNIGKINEVIAGNWDDEFTLTMGENDYDFVVLNVTASSGEVTDVQIAIQSGSITSDSVTKNTPPSTFKVMLGAIGRTQAKMLVDQNLQAQASEVFRETVTAPSVGGEPFARWWRWSVAEI